MAQRLVRRQKAADFEITPTGDVVADRLQAAIAELATEKATKAEVVDLISDQTIAGQKDFTDPAIFRSDVTLDGSGLLDATGREILATALQLNSLDIPSGGASIVSSVYGTFDRNSSMTSLISQANSLTIKNGQTISTASGSSSVLNLGKSNSSNTSFLITEARGFLASVNNSSLATFPCATNAYIIQGRLSKGNIANIATNFYGLHLQDVSGSGSTKSFSVYSAGGISYFKDSIGIGTETPAAKQHIVGGLLVSTTSTGTDPGAGNASVTGNITVGGNILKSLIWNTLTLVNAWSGTIQYAKLADGSVKLNGTLSRTTAPTNGQIIATLPTGFRPDRTYLFPTHNNNNNSHPYLQVDSSGNLTYIEAGNLPPNLSNMSTSPVVFNT